MAILTNLPGSSLVRLPSLQSGASANSPDASQVGHLASHSVIAEPPMQRRGSVEVRDLNGRFDDAVSAGLGQRRCSIAQQPPAPRVHPAPRQQSASLLPLMHAPLVLTPAPQAPPGSARFRQAASAAGFGVQLLSNGGKLIAKEQADVGRLTNALNASMDVKVTLRALNAAKAAEARVKGRWWSSGASIRTAELAVAQAQGDYQKAAMREAQQVPPLPRASREMHRVCDRLARYADAGGQDRTAVSLARLSTDVRLPGLLKLKDPLAFQTMFGGYGERNLGKYALMSQELVKAADAGEIAKFKGLCDEAVTKPRQIAATLLEQVTALDHLNEEIEGNPALRKSLQKEYGTEVVSALRGLWADLTSFLCEFNDPDGPVQRLSSFAVEAQANLGEAMAGLKDHMNGVRANAPLPASGPAPSNAQPSGVAPADASGHASGHAPELAGASGSPQPAAALVPPPLLSAHQRSQPTALPSSGAPDVPGGSSSVVPVDRQDRIYIG